MFHVKHFVNRNMEQQNENLTRFLRLTKPERTPEPGEHEDRSEQFWRKPIMIPNEPKPGDVWRTFTPSPTDVWRGKIVIPINEMPPPGTLMRFVRWLPYPQRMVVRGTGYVYAWEDTTQRESSDRFCAFFVSFDSTLEIDPVMD